MQRFVYCSSVLLLVLVSSLTANADIARPKTSPTPKKVVYTALQIATDPKANDAWLQIRESDLKEMLASVNGAERNTSIASAITGSSGRTVIAGFLLFASISFAGVWLARSKRTGVSIGKTQKALMITLIVAAVIGAGTIVTRGNAGPPPSYRWRSVADNLAKGDPTWGPVNVAIIPDDQMEGSGMKLILPLKKKTGSGEE